MAPPVAWAAEGANESRAVRNDDRETKAGAHARDGTDRLIGGQAGGAPTQVATRWLRRVLARHRAAAAAPTNALATVGTLMMMSASRA